MTAVSARNVARSSAVSPCANSSTLRFAQVTVTPTCVDPVVAKDVFDRLPRCLDRRFVSRVLEQKLPVVRDQRDRATDTIELQALKYAAYCSQLTLDERSRLGSGVGSCQPLKMCLTSRLP